MAIGTYTAEMKSNESYIYITGGMQKESTTVRIG